MRFARLLHTKPISLPVHFRLVKPDASIAKSLNAEDAIDTPSPIAIVVPDESQHFNDPQLTSHAQRIANGTGAYVLIPSVEDLSHEQQLTRLSESIDILRADEFKKRKIASVGFGYGGSLAFELGAKRQKENKSPLNGCVSFYGIPKDNPDVISLPIGTPVQAHFGQDQKETAFKLDELWMNELQRQGGFHSKGNHSFEESIYVYPNVSHGFMNEKPGINLDVVSKVWRNVFGFLTEHLKTV